MSPSKYLIAYTIPLLALLGLVMGSWWLLLTPLVTFGLYPLMELGLTGTSANLAPQEEKRVAHSPIYDWILYSLIPLQLLTLSTLLWRAASSTFAAWEVAAGVIAVGIACGAVGINVAHELGHRKNRLEQRLAKLLLLSVLYMHFFVEHNRGHHARVATDDDPNSARVGEWLYAFWVRSICTGWLSAWNLEVNRLARHKTSPWTLHNEVLRMAVMQVVAVGVVLISAGWVAMLSFLGAALIAVLLLETVNYIEHYGLRREKLASGKWGPVRPVHSWNANHTLGRGILFELTRHSDHHANPQRKYPILRHFHNSPQLPTGYPGMMVLATMPPLFFWVMHRCLAEWQQDFGVDQTAVAPELHTIW